MIKQIAKRQQAPKPLSEEHHELIIIPSRIDEGLRQNIDRNIIKRNTDWLKVEYSNPHFEL